MLDKCIKAAKAFMKKTNDEYKFVEQIDKDVLVFKSDDSYQFIKILVKQHANSFNELTDDMRSDMERIMITWFMENKDECAVDIPMILSVISFNIISEDRAIIRYHYNV